MKTAIAGEDANWGRIVMAIGKSGQRIHRERLAISIGGVAVARDGGPVAGYDEAPVAAHEGAGSGDRYRCRHRRRTRDRLDLRPDTRLHRHQCVLSILILTPTLSRRRGQMCSEDVNPLPSGGRAAGPLTPSLSRRGEEARSAGEGSPASALLNNSGFSRLRAGLPADADARSRRCPLCWWRRWRWSTLTAACSSSSAPPTSLGRLVGIPRRQGA